MTDPFEIRRKRALYRSHHRGTKELDRLLGEFASHHVPAMADGDLAAFERLLEAPDPALLDCLMHGADPSWANNLGEIQMLERLRAFHGTEANSRT
ncbi:MAG: succinate dehydrogenase assembly factor 2 [Alphaproteobacteria bacterium]